MDEIKCGANFSRVFLCIDYSGTLQVIENRTYTACTKRMVLCFFYIRQPHIAIEGNISIHNAPREQLAYIAPTI